MAEVMSIPVQLVTITLTAERFNVIIAGLKQLPYVISQPVIDELRAEVKSQVGE
jgi:hypothetical protein